MNLRIIGTIYAKELRDLLRDRRTLMATIIIPTFVMPALVLGVGRVASAVVSKAREEIPIVMVIGGADSPGVRAELEKSGKFRVETASADWKALISEKKVRAAAEIPEGFEKALDSGSALSLIHIYRPHGRGIEEGGRPEPARDPEGMQVDPRVRLALADDHACAADEGGRDVPRRDNGAGADRDDDLILAGGVDEDARRPGGLAPLWAEPRVDPLGAQESRGLGAKRVPADGAHKARPGAGPRGRDGLVRSLAPGPGRKRADDGLAGPWEEAAAEREVLHEAADDDDARFHGFCWRAPILQMRMTLSIPEMCIRDSKGIPGIGSRMIDATINTHHHADHTGGDAVVIFEKANVVHMGDLVFNRIYPFVDRPGGASVRGWIKSLNDSVASYPADAIYVFGHGNPKFGVTGRREDLLVMRDFLAAVLEHVQGEIAAGHDKAAVVGLENFPGFPDFHVPLPNRLGLVLGATYDELTAPPLTG